MSALAASLRADRLEALPGELRKLAAFLRRDFLVAWSYRLSFVTGALSLFVQVLVFAFVGKLIDPSVLPAYGGQATSYVEFVAIGLPIAVFLQIGLGQVMGAIRDEQMQGTLQSLLMTPTSPAIVQIGSVVFDLVYVPVRTVIFLLVVSLTFNADFNLAGAAPATVLLLLFVPIVWGFGVAAAGVTLTFKRGGGVVAFAGTLLLFGSGTHFPLELLPQWVESLATVNPLAIVVEGMREALLGDGGWGSLTGDVARLLPMAAASLVFGAIVFKLALRREKRLGTLGLY
jgi:ABC-2 type transport system permease protein